VVKSAATPRRWPRWLAQLVFGLAVAGLAVAGVIAVGSAARESLGPQDRYLLPFAEIDCPNPPGQDRAEFLEQVQYYGSFPDKVNVLDPTLPDQLRDAFAKHRRVERVDKVTILPPKRVRVELTFRPTQSK
jgi:hypothetical protein